MSPAIRAASREGTSISWRGLALGLALLGLSGCPLPLAQTCSQCAQIVVGEPLPVTAETRRVFVLVPGLLGYGWEWNGAQIALQQIPGAAVLVYSWDPWQSLLVSSEALANHLRYLLARLPRRVTEVVVIGHSAAGLLVTYAAAQLPPSSGGRLRVLAVGAPLAGMGYNPHGAVDMWGSPLTLALGGRFTRWPAPAPGVRLEVYPTSPADPVMRWQSGHDPADPDVLPPGTTLRPLPPEIDHNQALTYLAERLLAAARATARDPAL